MTDTANLPWRFERRLDVSSARSITTRVAGVIVALAGALVVFQLTGRSAADIAGESVKGTFGSWGDFQETLIILTPILTCGVAVALGFRIRVWNIGVEGQFLMGGWAATGIGLEVGGPHWLKLMLMALGAMAVGALWVLVPAVLKAYFGLNEVITTLLLTFVAQQILVWFSTDIWRDRVSAVTNASRRVDAEIPAFFSSDTLNWGFLIPVVLVLLMYGVFRSSRWGYEVEMTGGNPRAAEFAGIPVKRRIIGVMMLSGAIAGLGGMVQLAGSVHRLSVSFSNQYGFFGFIVAALAGASALALLFVGLFIAFLLRTGIAAQTRGLSVALMFAVCGMILLVVGIAETAARFRFVHGAPGVEEPGVETSILTPFREQV
jgi:general nucleoside transport system permease protein